MKTVIWTIKDIVEVLEGRQLNKFDGNTAISGDRGNGKSTLINKIFYRFKVFKPWIHQVYNRKDIIKLLKTQTLGLCWDDEAINSSYKRNFQDKGQQELIRILTAYRDNYNVFASAIPNFFSLDKDLRDLYFLHLHVIERGLAVVHMPIQGRLYSVDRWDSKYNAKIEESFNKKMMKNPNFRPPYNKLTTFRGYLFFGDLTEQQRQLYEEIKKAKREESFKTQEELKQDKSFIDKVYDALINGKLTRDTAITYCIMENEKWSSVNIRLNQMLKDKGVLDKTATDFLIKPSNPSVHNSVNDEIKQLLPNL